VELTLPADGRPDKHATVRAYDRGGAAVDARRAAGAAEVAGGAYPLLSGWVAHLPQPDNPVATDHRGASETGRLPRVAHLGLVGHLLDRSERRGGEPRTGLWIVVQRCVEEVERQVVGDVPGVAPGKRLGLAIRQRTTVERSEERIWYLAFIVQRVVPVAD